MKRLVALVLLALLSLGSFAAADKSPRMTPEENAKRSRNEIKQQQKMLKKSNKKQSKAAKKYEKQQRKAEKKANKNLRKRRTS